MPLFSNARFTSNARSPAVFQNRVRLNLKTSFTGKDLLLTRLSAGNVKLFEGDFVDINNVTIPLTPALQSAQFGAVGSNRVSLDWLAYFTNLGDKLKVYIPATGGLHYDYLPTINPALDSGDSGDTTLSMFGQRNPIYSIGGGTGIGLNYAIGNGINLSAGYLAGNANSSASGSGLFNGDNSFLAQISYVSKNSPFQIGLTYVNAYKKSGAIFDGNVGQVGQIGTVSANNSTPFSDLNGNAKVNAYGVSIAYQFSPKFVVNTFGSYINAKAPSPKRDGNAAADADIYTYGLGLSFPDFACKGNLLGLVIGVQPYLSFTGLREPLHIEAFYKYRVNDHISITPGVIWVRRPLQATFGGTLDNSDAIVGVIRTTFTF
ncbi:iron uptake porin [Leptolyngbyaceae cyanobacterium UHCC 1019]